MLLVYLEYFGNSGFFDLSGFFPAQPTRGIPEKNWVFERADTHKWRFKAGLPSGLGSTPKGASALQMFVLALA
jgi:hypothetical protein